MATLMGKRTYANVRINVYAFLRSKNLPKTETPKSSFLSLSMVLDLAIDCNFSHTHIHISIIGMVTMI